MILEQFLSPRLMLLDVEVQSKEELLGFLAERMAEVSPVLEVKALETALEEREALGGTAVGHGVALPHARVSSQFDPIVGLARLKQPLDFGASDGEPVWLAAFSALNSAEAHRHLQILAGLSRALLSSGNLQALRKAQSSEEMMAVLLGGNS